MKHLRQRLLRPSANRKLVLYESYMHQHHVPFRSFRSVRSVYFLYERNFFLNQSVKKKRK
jgi:hypothetical protein